MCSPNVYCIFIISSIILGADILDMKQKNSSLNKYSQISILVVMIIIIIICLSIIIYDCKKKCNCCKKSRSSYTEIV